MKELDLMLQELRGTEPYLDDNGFTSVVMAQVHEHPRELPLWVKNLLLLGATTIGSLIFAWQLPADLIGSVLIGMADVPALSMESLLAVAASNLPALLLGGFAFVYLLPYGAILVARRDAL